MKEPREIWTSQERFRHTIALQAIVDDAGKKCQGEAVAVVPTRLGKCVLSMSNATERPVQMIRGGERLRRSIELLVDACIAQNRLYVFAGFSEGDGFDGLR